MDISKEANYTYKIWMNEEDFKRLCYLVNEGTERVAHLNIGAFQVPLCHEKATTPDKWKHAYFNSSNSTVILEAFMNILYQK